MASTNSSQDDTQLPFEAEHRVFNTWLGRWDFVSAVRDLDVLPRKWHEVLLDPESRVRPEAEFPGVRRMNVLSRALHADGQTRSHASSETYNALGFLTKAEYEKETWGISYIYQCVPETIRIVDQNGDFLYDERRSYDDALRLKKVDATCYDASQRIAGRPLQDTYAKVFGNPPPSSPAFAVKKHTVYTFAYDEHGRILSMRTRSDVHPGNGMAEWYRLDQIAKAQEADIDAYYRLFACSTDGTLFLDHDADGNVVHVASTYMDQLPAPRQSLFERIIPRLFGSTRRLALCSMELPGLYEDELFAPLPIDSFTALASIHERRAAMYGEKLSSCEIRQATSEEASTFTYDPKGRVQRYFHRKDSITTLKEYSYNADAPVETISELLSRTMRLN